MSDKPDPNGQPASLAERVRSLKLAKQPMRQERRGTSGFAWVLCLLFAGLSAYLGYRVFTGEAAKSADQKGIVAAAAKAAESKPVEPSPGTVVLEAGGYVIPVRQVQVSPKVGGQVLELFIEEGQYVKKGHVLAKLDRVEYEFELQRMDALVEQSKAKYEELKNGSREEEKRRTEAALKEAEELYKQLQDSYNRVRRSGLASTPDELVKAQSELLKAEQKVEQLRQENKMMQDGPRKERIDAAKAEYLHAVAQRDKAKWMLDNTNVVAPVSGIILAKKAEVGNTVRPEAFSNGLSASLCDMADLKELEVDVDISERDLGRVFKGQKCQVRTEAFPDVSYKGIISRLMPIANRSKASVSVRVRIDVPESDALLRPEMRARVQFLAADKDKSTEKPKSATAKSESSLEVR